MQQKSTRAVPAHINDLPFAPASSIHSKYAGVSLALLAVVVLGLLLVWFGTLDMRHLLSSDEGRYAEISREMFASGDWVTIRYNELKYFEKPPFHMWVTALSYSLFGIGEWQARLCVALSGLVGIVVSMLAAYRWFGFRAALLTGLALIAMPMWSVAAHFNSLDMTLAGAMSCVLACMLMAQHPEATPQARRTWMLACWAAMGIAVLTKGLVGIALPGLVLVVYSLATRDLQLWRRLHPISGLGLMLLITVPWFLLVSERNHEFLHFFFVHEHWQRYTTTAHSRKGPLWYFVPLLVAGLLPWVGLLPRMLAVVRNRQGVVAAASAIRERPFQPALMMLIWAGAIFIFFSLSGSKLPGYIVPIFPALGILTAVALDHIDARGWRKQLRGMLVIAILGLLASPIVATLDSNHTPNALYRQYAAWTAVALLTMVITVIASEWLIKRRGVFPSISVYAIGMFLTFTCALLGHESVGRSSSGIDMVPAIRCVLRADMPLYGVRKLDHTLPFYLGHPLTMVEQADELDFGTQQEPSKWISDVETFSAVWHNGPHAMAILSPETYRDLAPSIPMQVIARDWRRVAVANFSPPHCTQLLR